MTQNRHASARQQEREGSESGERHQRAPSLTVAPLFITLRVLQLTAYIIDDHLDRSFHDRTLHLSIYNVTPKLGKRPEARDIFRHFVRTSDGGLIEAFEAADSLGADGYQKLEEKWLSQEATSVDDKEAEAEDMLKAMLSDQKRADAQLAGSRTRGLNKPGAAANAAASTSAGAGNSSDLDSMSHAGGHNMSVVQELSEERSEMGDAPLMMHPDQPSSPLTVGMNYAAAADASAMLGHIGEEEEEHESQLRNEDEEEEEEQEEQ